MPWLVLIVAIGVSLRIHGLLAEPVWLDEVYSYWFAMKPWRELWGAVPVYDPHPPLYYSFTKLATFGGTSESWLRLPALLFGILTIPIVYAASRIALGPRGRHASLLAASLFALNAFQIQYSQEARPYSMLACAVALLLLSGASVLRSMESYADPGHPAATTPIATRQWLLFGVCVGLVTWAHYTAAIVGATAGLTIAVISVAERRLRTDLSGLGLAAVAAGGVAALPLYWAGVQFLASAPTAWIHPPDLASTAGILERVAGLGPFAGLIDRLGLPWARISCATAVVGIAGFGTWQSWRAGQRASAVFLGAMAAVPLTLMIVLSLTLRPMLIGRTVIWEAVPLTLLAAAALQSVRVPVWRRIATVIVVAALMTSVVLHKRDFRKEPWDQITAAIISSVRPGDGIIMHPNRVELPFEYYWARSASRPAVEPPVLSLPAPFPSYVVPLPGVPMDFSRLRLRDVDIAKAVDASSRWSRTWLVTRAASIYDRDKRLLSALVPPTKRATVILDAEGTRLLLIEPRD